MINQPASLLLIKRTAEIAIKAKGHPAIILAIGVASGVAIVCRNLTKGQRANQTNDMSNEKQRKKTVY